MKKTKAREPKLSFVLPVHNGAAYIAHTIESIRQQTMPDWELIVVDDGSTDSTIDVLKFYFEKDHRIFIHKFGKRFGAAAARNRGNEMAVSGIILVTDCGDIQHPIRAKATHDHFTLNPENDIFHTSCVIIDEKGNWKDIQVAEPWNGERGVRPVICHPTVAYRKRVTEKVQYREVSIHTDLYEAFMCEASKAGFKFGHSIESFIRKREALNLPGNRNLKEAYQVKKKVYEEFGIPVPAHWGV